MNINARATLRYGGGQNNNPVALVGFGESRRGAEHLPADVPIWSLNNAAAHQIKRVTRLFDMHPPRDLVLEGERYQRLQVPQPFPVYMLTRDEKFPASVKYPIDEALATAFEFIYIGTSNARYITSTFGYMLISAVMEGYNPIKIYGFEFLSDTEHVYQAIGAALLIGWAGGKGVKVILPEGNPLLPPTLYGYEDYQMISRQTLEAEQLTLAKTQSTWIGKLNIAQALVQERTRRNYPYRFFTWVAGLFARTNGTSDAINDRVEAFKQVQMSNGALQFNKHYIDIVDRKQKKLAEEFEDLTFMVNVDDT